jgi:hypothetical protein
VDEWIGCDWRQCPARSLVHILITGRQLHFCGHHADLCMPRLLEVADMLTDDRLSYIPA